MHCGRICLGVGRLKITREFLSTARGTARVGVWEGQTIVHVRQKCPDGMDSAAVAQDDAVEWLNVETFARNDSAATCHAPVLACGWLYLVLSR